MSQEMFFLIILGVWLFTLSIFFFLAYRFFRKLTKGTGENELAKVLGKILRVQDENLLSISEIKKELRKLNEEGTTHVQKIGVVRFNPFKEIGGDHSFSLAILDGTCSGVIVTCLHTRERTRVYMKGIKKGKSDLDLSEEEKRALEKAIKG